MSVSQAVGLAVFLVIAVGGIYLVKWQPYYLKGESVAVNHDLGKSILSGTSAASPRGWHAALDYATSYGLSIWKAFVVGMLLAAGIQELLPRDWLLRMFGSARARSIGLGGLVAVPSMMCTCCAAPPAVAMARSRASAGATIAYWLGNPVINPATIVFMGLVLGWRWAALRIVMGLVLVFGVAALAQRLAGQLRVPAAATAAADAALQPDSRPLVQRFVMTLARLAMFLIPEYVVIVLVLGAVRAFLFPAISPGVGHALWLVILLAITGTLFVIPTAGEIPIIQTFLRFGLSSAGAGALMITLPAVSLPSMIMVGQAIPKRIIILVGVSVAIAGLVTAGLAAALGL
ncbi:MAG: permease [Actinobacteria bacterium]|nr:permease [Actinomycetota bacterium]